MSKYDSHIAALRQRGSNYASPELTERVPFPVLQLPGDVREVHARNKVPAYVASFNPEWQFILAHGYDRHELMVMVRKDWWPERSDWVDDKPWGWPEDALELRGGLSYWDVMNKLCDTALKVPNSLVVSDKSPWITPEKPMPVYELIPALDRADNRLGTIQYVAVRSVEESEDEDGPCVIFVEAHPVNHPAGGLVPRVFKVDTYSRQLPGSMLNSSSIDLAFRFAGRRGYRVVDTGRSA